jgi:hypothetical protein
METVKSALALLFLIFAGWNVLRLIYGKTELYMPEEMAVSYGLGVGFVSFQMLIFYLLRLKFSVGMIAAPWIAVFAVNMMLSRHRARQSCLPALKDSPGRSGLKLFLISAIAIETAYAFFRALIKPLESYDAIAIYAIKSKIFFLARSIPQEFFDHIAGMYPHPDYPLNIPLAETFIYLSIGSLNDQLVKALFPLFFTGILCLMYYAVRRFSTKVYALLFTFIIATIPQVNANAANGYLDLALGFYYFASALFLFRWVNGRDDTASLAVSACLAGLAAWTKNEGLMYCVINMCVVVGVIVLGRKKISVRDFTQAALYLLILAVICAPWILVKASANIANDEIDLANLNPVNLLKQAHKIMPVLYEFQKQFFGPKKWLILWPAAAAVILLRLKKAFSGTVERCIFISLVMAVSGYALFYMISYVDVGFFTSKTWARFLLHFLPLVVYWMAITLKDEGLFMAGKDL